MAVPKKRTSYSKKKIRKNRWFKNIVKHAKRFYQQVSRQGLNNISS